ncbi:alanyl-tRNA editing protein [Candidatus Parcubacteria bacterium]|nr:alanyl-tRNA editing protein [Candidatus Parcubacteria bacterium]
MELIFYQDQYNTEIDAEVIKVEGNKILLDKTIFIPQTNTEPGDFGKIDDVKIAGSQKQGDDVWHIIPQNNPFEVGDKVKLKLDWKYRLNAMKLHSALHLLAGVFDSKFQQRAIAGVVKSKNAYLVFKNEIQEQVIQQAIEQANTDIKLGAEIKTYWDEKKKGFRWCAVKDYPPIPCGGLHVKNIKEIQGVKITKTELDGDNQKIFVELE